MNEYLEAVRTVLERGTRKANRTGVDTLSTFGVHYNIDLQVGFPLLTTKAMSWKNIVAEMLWFLSGQTDIGILKKHGCKFWDAWADPATGEVPSAYGNFWRRFPVHPSHLGAKDSEWDNDQLDWLVAELKRNPMSRRMVVSAWAPGNAQTSKLPPCHCLFVANVQNAQCIACDGDGGLLWQTRKGPKREDCPNDCRGQPIQRLCLHLTQRSCDIALGVPYNIASYALLAHLLARFTGNMPLGIFSHTLVDAHAYTCKADGSMVEYDHVPGLREQLTRAPRALPRLTIDPAITSLDDVPRLLTLSTDELMRLFPLVGYDPHPAINFKVAV